MKERPTHFLYANQDATITGAQVRWLGTPALLSVRKLSPAHSLRRLFRGLPAGNLDAVMYLFCQSYPSRVGAGRDKLVTSHAEGSKQLVCRARARMNERLQVSQFRPHRNFW